MQLFRAIKSYLRRYDFSTADILDDNFLKDKDYVRELGSLIRNDAMCQERDFGYYTFANLVAIAQYSYEELVEYGVRGLLIGVESKFTNKLERNISRKMIGVDTREVFENLLDHGIYIDGSMILGWDFHNKENIMEDIDHYISLGSTSDQIVCLVPLPETKLWKDMKEKGRLSEAISWDEGGFYTKWLKYKNFKHEELWEYEDLALRRAYETWGPTYLRFMDVYFRGYRRFKNHNDPFFRRKAEFHKKRCQNLYPLLRCIKIFAPNQKVSDLAKSLRKAFVEEFGRPTLKQNVISIGAVLIGGLRKIQQKMVSEDTFQPKCKVFHY
jgi:hypothetical protein